MENTSILLSSILCCGRQFIVVSADEIEYEKKESNLFHILLYESTTKDGVKHNLFVFVFNGCTATESQIEENIRLAYGDNFDSLEKI